MQSTFARMHTRSTEPLCHSHNDRLFVVCNIPLLARRTRPKRARDDRLSCIQGYFENKLHSLFPRFLLSGSLAVVLLYHSAGKHDRGPLFFTLFLFRLIRSRSTGSI